MVKGKRTLHRKLFYVRGNGEMWGSAGGIWRPPHGSWTFPERKNVDAFRRAMNEKCTPHGK